MRHHWRAGPTAARVSHSPYKTSFAMALVPPWEGGNRRAWVLRTVLSSASEKPKTSEPYDEAGATPVRMT
eukprot:8174026-Pyramimonas_sp.AAC.1